MCLYRQTDQPTQWEFDSDTIDFLQVSPSSRALDRGADDESESAVKFGDEEGKVIEARSAVGVSNVSEEEESQSVVFPEE